MWLILIPLILAACAPRVSKKGPAHPVASKPTPIVAAPVAAAPAPAAAAAPAAAPVAPPPAWKPAAAPAPVAVASADTAPEGDAEEDAPAAVAKKPAQKKTYYAYSDSQITAMRKQSGEFRRLDDDLKRCSEKSAEGIERREEIPAEIAKIRMSKGGLSAKKEKQIEKLRAEQERLKGADMSQCAAMESKLTQLLEGTYAEKDEGGLY